MATMDEIMRDAEQMSLRNREQLLAGYKKDYNLASEFYTRLVKWINDFEGVLDEKHEVGVRLVSFGQTVVFHLDDISYWNPSLIKFIGKTGEGQFVELIQHVTQISVLLMALPRLDPTRPKKKIGFVEESDQP